KDLAAGHSGSGIAAADLAAPADHRSLLGKLIDNAGLAPDAVALWAEPLWPVVGVGRWQWHEQCDQQIQACRLNENVSNLHREKSPSEAEDNFTGNYSTAGSILVVLLLGSPFSVHRSSLVFRRTQR